MDVGDRRMQVRLTRQAKTPSDFLLSEGVFAFTGFVSGLRQSSKTLPLYGLKAAILNCVLSTESSSILPQSFFSVDA